MSSFPPSPNHQDPLDQARRTRQSLAERLQRAVLRERDVAISSRLQNDTVFRDSEKSASELRRLLHRIRQNVQKKQLSIEIQRRRLAATEATHAEFVAAKVKHEKELDEVMAQIEGIKKQYSDQLVPSTGEDGSAR